jgi:hypothetical protein
MRARRTAELGEGCCQMAGDERLGGLLQKKDKGHGQPGESLVRRRNMELE